MSKGATMHEVKFAQYRDYCANRVLVNNAMTALLAASKLSGHTLADEPSSPKTLTELYPGVPHIDRFNMASGRARVLLADADHHVATVAIPYALSTHEVFVMSVIDLLREHAPDFDPSDRIMAYNMHETIYDYTGEPTTHWLDMFHVLREMRNSIIHNNGAVNTRLLRQCDNLDELAVEEWKRLNRGKNIADEIKASSALRLSAEQMFTAFAVTKHIGRELNHALAVKLPTRVWARIAIEDYSQQNKKQKNSSSWQRALKGFIGHNYKSAKIQNQEIREAVLDSSHWTCDHW